jgi:outer membrane protein assembly factor BamD
MKRGYHTKALENFNRVRNYHRDDPVSVKAQLAIADVHFKKGDFEQARFTYEEFATYHPRHENLDYVTYRIGLSIYKRASKLAGRDQSPTRGAVNNWTGFNTRFPESSYVEEVEKLLTRSRNRLAAKELYVAKFYADRDAWGSVRLRAEYLLRRYPNTDPAPDALVLLGTALHSWGEVEKSAEIRARLERDFPGSVQLKRLDRVQAKAPGSRPDERVFIRPYRIRGVSSLGGGAY